MLDTAMTVCRRNLLDLDDIIDNPFREIIKDSEWDILCKDERKKYKRSKIEKHKTSSVVPVRGIQKINQSPNIMDKKLNSKREVNTYKSPSIVTLKLPEIENKQMYSTVKDSKAFFADTTKVKDDILRSMIDTKQMDSPTEPMGKDAKMMIKANTHKKTNAHDNLMRDVKNILERCDKKFPQYKINGDKNIWILKPAGLSRGRGIQVFSNLDDIRSHIYLKESNWIAQKYIENPLIINRRKFDLRIWVLVTSVNPLTIWFWDKPYVRFPAADYNDTNLSDRFIHLTNNSVAKNCKDLPIVGDGNMWFIEQLQEYLKAQYGRDVWNDEIKQKCKDIIIYSLQAVQDQIDNRKGSMELLGYDVMIDDKFNTWLIEVNSSPTMEYSTGVTKVLAQNVMESIVKVISDYDMAPKGTKKKDIDTGDFVLIYKGKKYTEKGLNTFGQNFC